MMAKDEFLIWRISREQASGMLQYHYLSSRNFKSGFNYGLFRGNALLGELLGTCIFTCFPVPELVEGIFGLDRDEQDGMFELSRLCLHPSIQDTEHNMASWFVARCIKRLRNDTGVRAILAYADADYHEGIVYRASNFKYYGLTDSKSDFWFSDQRGDYTKHSRGKTKGIRGEWRPRSRKHRYLMVFDRSLDVLWTAT